MRERLEKMLANGRDDALVRFSLGNACLSDGDVADAVTHLRAALGHDADYSAAWKLLGKALEAAGETYQALEAYTDGVAAAQRRGDMQASREMQVFAKRLAKKLET